MTDPNRTQMAPPPVVDPNRTMMGTAPTLNATQTIKPVQCPVCRSFNPLGVMFCVDCGLIFDRALPEDAFGAPTVQMPVLIDPSGREHTLRPGEVVIGRQGDVSVEDSRVSRRHASLTFANGEISVLDLGSTNGTKVDGQVVGATVPAVLGQGGKLSLGGYELTLSLPGEAAKTAMPISGKTIGMTVSPAVAPSGGRLLGSGHEFALKQGQNTFGRRDGNDVTINDPYVSGKHGIIEITEEGVFITDIGSTNGTMLNEARLGANMRTRMEPGDVIRLGSLEFRVEIP